MKTYRYLIFLAIFSVPLLSGCNLFGYGDNSTGVAEPDTTTSDIILAAEINEKFTAINAKIDAIALTPGPQGGTGADCVDAADHTADLCALYVQLYDSNMIGTLPLPSFCE